MKYEDLYIQPTGASLFKLSDYGCYLTKVDAPLCGDVKEPYKVTWMDEDGDDEYFPDRMFFESFEITFGVVAKSEGRIDAVRSDALDLISALTSNNPLILYDKNSLVGWAGVRFIGCSNTSYHMIDKDDGIETILEFDLKFKVNYPTALIYTNEDEHGEITALDYSTL